MGELPQEPEGDADRSEPATGDRDDLTPPIARTGMPEQLRRDREAQAARDDLDRQRWKQAIEAHIAAHRLALDHLAETHQWIADELDLDLVGDTRPAAIWQMAGRCLGIARLVLDSLELGYTAEVLHLARALHEADRLVEIFGIPEGTDLLRKWLADEGDDWVRPGEVRAADAVFEERLATAMREAGLPELDRSAGLTQTIYGEHSQAAHHRRRWTQDAVFPQVRTMLRGRTTVWSRRGATTAAMVAVVEECVVAVGDALAPFLPRDWYDDHIKPFVATFEALRMTQPLPS